MKKVLTAALALLIPLLISPSAEAIFIGDTYWGGTEVAVSGSPTTPTGDVIGANFEVLGMDVTRSGGNITVVLSGPFFAPGALANTPGDLYISTTGLSFENPTSPPTYPYDKFTTAEGWNYYVSYRSTPTTALRPLGGTIQGTLNSALNAVTGPVGGGPGRINQALSGGLVPGDPEYAAIVTLDTTLETLTFFFPDLWPTETLGLHWTMLCGNDVVEVQVDGGQQVPEPGTMLLAGCGLIALAAFRRKFKK
jgi:hypothetical protein